MSEQKTYEELASLELVVNGLKGRIQENNGSYSETLHVKPNGQFDFADLTDNQGHLKSLFLHYVQDKSRELGSESLYRFAFELQQFDPRLVFTFERNEDVHSITYTVRENPKTPNS